MSRLARFSPFALAAVLGAMTFALPARADVAPPDQCTGKVGSACNNAGKSYKESGVCTKAQCPRYNPADGGVTQTDCTLCELDSSASGSASTGSGNAGGGGGCSLGGAPATGGFAALSMLALGIAALVRGCKSTPNPRA